MDDATFGEAEDHEAENPAAPQPWVIVPDGPHITTLVAESGAVVRRSSLAPQGYMSAEDLADSGVLEQVTQVGDYFSASCPAHPDNNPSFIFGDNEDEPGVWVKDQSGACSRDEILDSLDDMGVSREAFSGTFMPGNKNGKGEYRRVLSYPYVDETGKVRLWNIRGAAEDGRTQFSQAVPLRDPNKDHFIDGRSWGFKWLDSEQIEQTRIPYRLPELLAGIRSGNTVVIAEGEKDAEAFFDAAIPGIVATTNAAGAGNWTSAHSEFLADAETVIVCCDLDVAGFKRALDLRKKLPEHVQMSIIVPAVGEFGDKHGADAADHFGAGLSFEDFVSVSIDNVQSTLDEFARRDRAERKKNLKTIDGGSDNDEDFAGEETSTASFSERLDNWIRTPGAEFFRIPLEGGRFLVANNQHFGICHDKEVDDNYGNTHKVTDNVFEAAVWRSKAAVTFVVDKYGNPLEHGGRAYTVAGVLKDGSHRIVEGLTAEESTDIRRVTDALDLGIGVPLAQMDRQVASNMLRTLGHGERANEERIAQTGWINWHGRICHVTPQSTITSDGPLLPPLSVCGPVGSDEGALKPAMQSMGFPDVCRTPGELATAIESVNNFIGIAPNRPDIPVALLGLVFASFCRLSRRGSVLLNAEPDSAKSLIASATQAFVSDTPINGKEFPVSIPDASEAGVNAVSTWGAHMPLVFDDYKTIKGDKAKTTRMNSVLMLAAQLAYGSSGGTKSNQQGGLSFRGSANNTAIITAEKLPADMAILQRCLNVVIQKGDIQVIATDGKDKAPIDEFRIRHHAGDKDKGIAPGNARRLTGTFVAWLAKWAEACGSLEEFTKVTDAKSLEYLHNRQGSRSAETVSVVETGWAFFRQFCVATDVDHLVDFDAIHEQLDVLVTGNKNVQADQDAGRELVEMLGDKIAQRHMHVANFQGGCPREHSVAVSAGWRKNEGRDEFMPTNTEAGRYSKDGQQVLITSNVIWDLARRENPDITKPELRRSLKAHVAKGTKLGERSDRSISQTSARGYVFDVEVLNLSPCLDHAKGESNF